MRNRERDKKIEEERVKVNKKTERKQHKTAREKVKNYQQDSKKIKLLKQKKK